MPLIIKFVNESSNLKTSIACSANSGICEPSKNVLEIWIELDSKQMTLSQNWFNGKIKVKGVFISTFSKHRVF